MPKKKTTQKNVNTHCLQGSDEEIHWPSGTYQDQTAQASCQPCPAGGCSHLVFGCALRIISSTNVLFLFDCLFIVVI